MNGKTRFIMTALTAFNFSCSSPDKQNVLISLPESPNIIFVFIDDMGYGDLGSYGNAGVKTPHIDKLAAEGIRFTQFYVNSPMCSPSRAAVMTGQYPLRWNITSALADSARNISRGMAHYLNPKAPSLARILQSAGYYTAHVGKWHLGGQRNVRGAPLITEFGFNSSLTSFEGLGERLGYTFDSLKWNGSHQYSHSVLQAKLGRGDIRWVKRHEEPQIFVDRTLAEIQQAQDKDQPFYINLWLNSVHTPLEAPPELRGNGSLRAQYFGVIRELDSQLGRLFEFVRDDPEIRKNTLIILSSDNGPSHEIGSSGGLRDHKGSLYEGGIRVPFIVWAPGMIKKENTGKVNNNTILAGMDLPPSLLSIAGIETPESIHFDGLDMSKGMLGETENRKQAIMWIRPTDAKGPPGKEWKDLTIRKDLAIREGNWKLLVSIDGSDPELYDLQSDPGETINLASQNPEIASDLQVKVLDWFNASISNTTGSIKPWE